MMSLGLADVEFALEAAFGALESHAVAGRLALHLEAGVGAS